MNIINNNKEKHKMLRIRAIILGILTVAVSMAAEASEAVQVAIAASKGSGLLGASIGAGLVVLGAGLGIGLLAFAAANATARQPEAAADIRATVNLPLFLLVGVAIFALVVCILAVVL